MVTRSEPALPGPIRTCLGCRRRRSAADLVRYRIVDGRLVAGRGPGRGAYTCPDAACYAAARRRGAFTRVLRGAVTVPEEPPGPA